MNKKIGLYTIDSTKLDEFLPKKQVKKVFVQLPEGLQSHIREIKEWLESYDVTLFFDANPTYGACDLPTPSMLTQLEIDIFIQIGHLPIPSMQFNQYSITMLFINAQLSIPINSVIEKSLSELTGHNIGVVTTAQHIHQLPTIKKILMSHGFKPVLSEGDLRIHSSAQVLGCNFTAAKNIAEKIDSFLFIGSGVFHPIGLLLSTNKPIVCADPYTNQIIDSATLNEKKQVLLRQRYGAITFGQQANTIAIIIGLKPGQNRYDQALKLRKKVLDADKKCLLLTTNMLHPSFTDRYPFVDVFVSTACPRIAIDDYNMYKKPILTPIELEIALGEKDWDTYIFDEILE